MVYRIPDSEYSEFRRLVQRANRRIVKAHEWYRKAGKDIAPEEVVGRYQVKESWAANKTAISRGRFFESEREYKQLMKELSTYDPSLNKNARPSISTYGNIQQEKTLKGVESSLGVEVPDSIKERVRSLTAPELTDFWIEFSQKASKLGLQYSSLQAMQDTLNELYPDDIKQFDVA